jgi:predicted kinase
MTQDEIIEMAIQGHASTRDAIRWAMNQEREACAKIADEWAVGWPHPSQVIAERIRARKQA